MSRKVLGISLQNWFRLLFVTFGWVSTYKAYLNHRDPLLLLIFTCGLTWMLIDGWKKAQQPKGKEDSSHEQRIG